ncbi:MAG: multicopper oxidase domain-containing protein, partial [Thermoplasmatota archaeon]
KNSDPHFDNETTLILDEMDKYHVEGGNPQGQNQPQTADPYEQLTWVQRQSQDTVDRNPQVQSVVDKTPVQPPRDWYPFTPAPYYADLNTFLINGHAFPYTAPVIIQDGKILRIRLINAGDQLHVMHLHGHHFLVTHKDGVLLPLPYWADSLPIAPGERYDIYVVGNNPGIWDFHDNINENLQNDHIWPGGMMTLLVYQSYMDKLKGAHHHAGYDGLDYTWDSGAFVNWFDRESSLP